MILITNVVFPELGLTSDNIEICFVGTDWGNALSYIGDAYEDWVSQGGDAIGIVNWLEQYEFWEVS